MQAAPATNTNSWDPLQSMQNRMPTPAALKRIRSDIRNLFKDPLPGERESDYCVVVLGFVGTWCCD